MDKSIFEFSLAQFLAIFPKHTLYNKQIFALLSLLLETEIDVEIIEPWLNSLNKAWIRQLNLNLVRFHFRIFRPTLSVIVFSEIWICWCGKSRSLCSRWEEVMRKSIGNAHFIHHNLTLFLTPERALAGCAACATILNSARVRKKWCSHSGVNTKRNIWKAGKRRGGGIKARIPILNDQPDKSWHAVQEKLLSCSAQREGKVAHAFCALCVVAIKKSFRHRSSATIFHLPRGMETKSVRHFLNYKRLVAAARWQLLL